MRRPSTVETWRGSNGSIILCRSAIWRIQRSDLMVKARLPGCAAFTVLQPPFGLQFCWMTMEGNFSL
jgi:hypothetical protein